MKPNLSQDTPKQVWIEGSAEINWSYPKIGTCDESIDFLTIAICRTRAILPVGRRRHAAQRLNLFAVKWRAAQYKFEAIIIGGVMAAGYLYAAIGG